ncbi:phosphoheptose isomerase [Denitratisoma sp. DHT3]|uniref:accessory factor UbiK family protein n=1 Tax=Denitratisoma sp. DHT3 TaxID=1981880 RepID=UPI00119883EB|nr:accessory factor UbiK family protein [Denitratisoma sp. DHT3]QDX81546.1 phosphoheptose isomerase [Denitratisoma sp. DHT3]
MSPTQLFDEVAHRLSQLAATSPAADLEKNARALMTGLFSRLDLVTREEFEIQRALLAHARERIDALEARVAQLEQAKPGQ